VAGIGWNLVLLIETAQTLATQRKKVIFFIILSRQYLNIPWKNHFNK